MAVGNGGFVPAVLASAGPPVVPVEPAAPTGAQPIGWKVDVTPSPVEGAINYFKFSNQETDRQLATAAQKTGKPAPQAFADTILDDPMILPVGPDTNFPLFFFAAPRSNLSAPSYNRLAEAPYVPVTTQLQLVNSSGRVLPVRDSTGQGLQRVGDAQQVLGKASLNFKAGFTFRSAASARPDAFVIAPMGKDFPQGNTVDLGDKYRLVIKGVGVTESNMVTPTLAYALGDPVPLATFKNKTLLSVIAAYTKKKDAGV